LTFATVPFAAFAALAAVLSTRDAVAATAVTTRLPTIVGIRSRKQWVEGVLHLKYLIEPQVLNELLKTGLGRNLPAMPAIVKNDPWWLDPKDPHRVGYVHSGVYDISGWGHSWMLIHTPRTPDRPPSPDEAASHTEGDSVRSRRVVTSSPTDFS
jgi:hypothetical protein